MSADKLIRSRACTSQLLRSKILLKRAGIFVAEALSFKEHITANIIALGYFKAGLLYQIPEELRNQIKESIPLKDFGNPSEVVECILYLQ